MPYKSRWPIDVPNISIPDFVLGPEDTKLPEEKLFIDVNAPDANYLTTHTLRQWSKRLAAGLRTNGLQQGDRLMFFSGNHAFTPVIILGIMMAGGIFVSANPAFKAWEFGRQAKDCSPKFVLAAEPQITTAVEGCAEAGISKESVFIFDNPSPTGAKHPITPLGQQHSLKSWIDLLVSEETSRNFEPEPLDTPALADRTAMLLYSSGTTGLPKGVEATHRNIVTSIIQVTHIQDLKGGVRRDSRRALCALPLFHGLGLVYYCFIAPANRMPVYVMERYSLDLFLRSIEKHRITELLLVPPVVVAMAKSSHVAKYNLASVRRVVAGAAPLGMEATILFEKLWPANRTILRQGWGMSELPVMPITWDDRDETSPSSTSVGELLCGVEAMIVGPDGKEMTDGSPGELWCRCPNAMKQVPYVQRGGYWRNPAATVQTKNPEGWLKTGDIARVDANGKFYIVDRIKELIKVRGSQVAPAQLEALLLEHPDIADAAVIGIKTVTGDEEPRAYVVRRQDSVLTERQVVDFVAARVSKKMQIRAGAVFVNEIPKNPSGKILRRELREKANGKRAGLAHL